MFGAWVPRMNGWGGPRELCNITSKRPQRLSMPRSPDEPALPSRRQVVHGGAVAAAALLIDGCNGAPSPAPTTPASLAVRPLPDGLEVRGTRFTKNGQPFFVSGINYWAGTTLARTGNVGGWDQVRRDLDGIQRIGINMIRTLAASEGPDTEPQRIVPTIQPTPGRYDPAGVEGVLRFAEELQRGGGVRARPPGCSLARVG